MTDHTTELIQKVRGELLGLLREYQELEKPANEELLKLHIEAYEDRILALISDRERLAYLEGQKAGKNNYHLGYLSKDDQYAIERETIAARTDELEKLPTYPKVYNPDCISCGVRDRYRLERLATLRKELTQEVQTDV